MNFCNHKVLQEFYVFGKHVWEFDYASVVSAYGIVFLCYLVSQFSYMCHPTVGCCYEIIFFPCLMSFCQQSSIYVFFLSLLSSQGKKNLSIFRCKVWPCFICHCLYLVVSSYYWLRILLFCFDVGTLNTLTGR